MATVPCSMPASVYSRVARKRKFSTLSLRSAVENGSFLFLEPNQTMKCRRTNKVIKFKVEKAEKKGAVIDNVIPVAISPRSPSAHVLQQGLQEGLICIQAYF